MTMPETSVSSAASVPVLAAQSITKSFLGVVALDHVDFSLAAGEIHALLGENGAGKSTLIKILTGAYHGFDGVVALNGAPIAPASVAEAQTLGIGTVYQEVNLLENLTVAENIYLGRQPLRLGFVNRRKMEQNARSLLARYGLAIDVSAPLSAYSVAIRQIIAIARAVDLSGKVLVLDEPTASLDAREVAMLFAVLRQLKDQGLGIIIITHFLDQVYAIADRVTVLRNGRLVGSRKLAELPRPELISMMLGHQLQEAVSHQREETALSDTAAPIRFANYGKKGSVAPFDLSIRAGEAIGIAGLLGSGRTETALLLFGVDQADSGSLTIDGREVRLNSPVTAIAERFAFLPEERKSDGIIGDFSVAENIALAVQAKRGWAHPLSAREMAELADHYIRALDIRPPDPDKPIKLLSGGNQQKAVLARWLATEPRVLILDEPTRGIDIGAHAEILKLISQLCADGMALVIVSSEFEELAAVADRVIVMSDRHHVAQLVGSEISADSIVGAIANAGHNNRHISEVGETA